MATIRSSIPHEDRTATEPRENRLEPVILSHIREVNPTVRLLRLNPVDPGHTIKFSPGQWVDTFIPGLPKAGGFTISSAPSEARPRKHSPPYLELAIQKSRNPPAQWLWKPEAEILGSQLVVRVGGSFVWPPPRLDVAKIDRLVLVAGGVGIKPKEIHFLYTTRVVGDGDIDPQAILFLPRLMDLVAAVADHTNITLSLFLTGPAAEGAASDDRGIIEHGKLPNRTLARRITEHDLVQAIDGFRTPLYGPAYDRRGTVCYVCGPPAMTDGFVGVLNKQEGMAEERILCEKWW
ncbi:hypothetical protein LTS10_011028 [Elasticomyces elasticus]|nr:hypothetical protein LTS10_011028 [Elasticomyces elasticus]